MLPETGVEAAVRTAERLREQVQNATFPAAPDLRFTISVGVAESGDSINELRDWTAAADAALYRAKAAGRNRVA